MQSAVQVVVPEQIIGLLAPPGLRYTHSNVFLTNLFRSKYWPLHTQVLGIWQLCVTLVQQFAPCAVLCLLAHLPLCIRQALRRAVGLVMKPVNIRSIHSVNTGQRLMAVLIGVDIT